MKRSDKICPKCRSDFSKNRVSATEEELMQAALGLDQDASVINVIISQLFADKIVVPHEFTEWFASQPHKSVMTISEVVDAYETFRKQHAEKQSPI